MTFTKKKNVWIRMLAGVLLCCMLLGELVGVVPVLAAELSGLNLSLNQYTSDLAIYNYLCYTSGTGTVQTGSGTNFYVLKGTSNVNVSVGDIGQSSGDTRPMDKDIQLQIEGLNISSGKQMSIYPVYGGKRAVRAEITSASTIDKLVVSEGAKLVITLKAALTIHSLELKEMASLEILTNSHTITVSNATGMGNLIVSGNGTLNCQNVSIGSITLNNVTVDGQETGTMTAQKELAVNGATVQNMVLFGYDHTVTGNKTISFNGGYFTNVDVVGAKENTGAVVTIKGIDTIASSFDTNYVYDYSITYMAGDTALTPQEGWPVAYRVKHNSPTNAETTVLGYVSDQTFTACSTVLLPSYGTAFFGYDGWELNGEKITELSSSQMGEIVLAAVLEPGTVTVEMMLGYVPNTNTNDTPLPSTSYTTTSSIGTVLDLSTPTRFGYIFKGWRVVSGNNNGTYSNAYTISSEDLETVEGSDTFRLVMEAVWEKDRFPIRLMLGTAMDTARIQISLDGGSGWMSFNAFVNNLPSNVTYDNNVISFSDYIGYEESLEAYFTRVLGGYPLLKDDTNEYTFATWYNSSNGAVVTQNDVYRYGNGILVRAEGYETLTQWQTDLKAAPIILTPLWVVTTYEYTLSVNKFSDWTILVNGDEAVPNENNEIKVQLGSKVTFRSPIASKTTLSYWSVTNVSNVTERAYSVGDAWLYYDFDMPASDVVATCRERNDTSDGDQLYIDLAKSPITFAEQVVYNGRAHNGFYYNVKLADILPLFWDAQKGYFYIWDSSEPFHVTTNNVATKNQLRLVNHLSGGVYLKNCHLEATDAYSTGAVGVRLGGDLMEAGSAGAPAKVSVGEDWSMYGNIVLDNNINPSYTTNLYVRGTNTIAAIMASNANTSSAYSGILNIIGSGKAASYLTLGSVTCIGELNVKALTITEYDDNYDYLFYTLTAQMNCDNIDISDCAISAHTKRIYNSFNYINVRSTDLDIGSVFVAYSLRLYGTSYVRVRGDVVCHYYLIDVKDKSSLVVDGGVYTMNHTTAYGEGTISTSGYVIVKGMGIVTTGLTVSGNAVVVANMITANRAAAFKNGVVVTNMITNPLTTTPKLNGDAYEIRAYTYADGGGVDQYPFYSYSNKRQTVSAVEFSGSKVYLFGYYKGTTGSYDTTNNLKDDLNNPVKAIADALLDENGDLIAAYKTASNRNEVAASAQASVEEHIAQGLYKNRECVATGDSSHTEASAYAKSVKIAGGVIYSVGNLNFFNDTTVTGGKIVCGGTFGSRRDLTISGGEIEAYEVGISYDRTTTENGLERYSMLTLAGGTIKTDRIGAHSTAPDVVAKGVVYLQIGAKIVPHTAEAVTVSSNLRANYLFDSTLFEQNAGNPVSLDFVGVYKDGTISDIALSNEIQLVAPILKSGGTAMWLYDDPNGEQITTVSRFGLVNGDETLGYCVYSDRLAFALYAAKGEYTLSINSDYSGTGFEIRYDGVSYKQNATVGVKAGAEVSVKLDNDTFFERTIIWYQDAAGIWHNVCASDDTRVDENEKTITFNMPYADTEIWITFEFTLYLDEYSISFTEGGFALEEASADRRADSVFNYAGNVRIAQRSTAKTYNRIFFETASSGNETTGRKITLYELRQDTLGTLFGIVLANGAKVEFIIDHRAGSKTVIAPVEVPQHASVAFVGANGDAAKNTLSFRSYLTLNNYTCVGATVAGEILYQELTLSAESGSYLQFARSTNKTTASVRFIKCNYTKQVYYTYDLLAYNMDSVIMEDCDFKIYGSPDLSSSLVTHCTNLTMINSQLTYSFGGTRGGRHPFEGVSEMVTLDGSTVTVYYNRTTSSSKTNLESPGLFGKLVLRGNAKMILPERIAFRSIDMSGDSVITVGEGKGYLFCPDISISENAALTAGYVIISGFVISSSYADKQAVLGALAGSSPLNGASYQGLLMSGGRLNATYFIGGDRNAKLNISGGEVNTTALGTYGAYFGYGKYVPNQTENEFVYVYNRIASTGTVVNISGGTVTIDGGYLGGIYTSVNITGGQIQLDSGAVLGMTEAQKTSVYNQASEQGKIDELVNVIVIAVSGGSVTGSTVSAPYGNITVSGSAAMRVQYFVSENGNISILQIQNGYENPYVGSQKHQQVGVLVEVKLEAFYLHIDEGAIVYAETAYTYADAATSGTFLVSNGAHLYTGQEYGSRGEGDSNVSEDGGTIHGRRRYYIHYVLGGDTLDPAYNAAENPSYYIANDEIVYLSMPTRGGYDFVGWYTDADFSEPITYISKSTEKNHTIYAKWKPKETIFVIQIDVEFLNREMDDSITLDELKEEILNVPGELSGSIFTYEKRVSVKYLDEILVDGRLNLNDYMLPSYQISEVKFSDTNQKLYPFDRVTKEMLNGEVVLKVSAMTKTRMEITLDMNLSAGLPVDSQFNYDTLPDGVQLDRVQSYVDIGAVIGTANGFTVDGNLIVPSAPGYRFEGWYTDPACSGEPITSAYIIDGNACNVFYAKWVAKEYYIVFDPGVNDELSVNNKITVDETQPSLDGGNHKFVVRITYDAPFSSAKYYYSVSATDEAYKLVELTDMSSLPTAWALGYVHHGSWYYVDINGSMKEIALSTRLNLTNIKTADWTSQVASEIEGVPVVALTFLPVLERIKIVYDTNGGTVVGIDDNASWKQDYSDIALDAEKPGVYTMQTSSYGKPMLGYTANVAPSLDYELVGSTIHMHEASYSIVSTSGNYYNANKQYVANDYRFVIGNKGYTFQGWRVMQEVNGTLVPKTDDNGQQIYLGHFPQYEDVTVQAVWMPNTYEITLRPYEEGRTYDAKFNEVPSISIGSLTVGEHITGIANWPTRDQGSSWYAYNPSIEGNITDEQKRYLLGFTFDPLDPGDTSPGSDGYSMYKNYSVYITTLLTDDYADSDSEDIYVYSHSAGSTPGTIFRLPGDSEYSEDKIPGIQAVPDYPAGSAIDMYAVYRERSLVFMEYYKDGAGNITKRFLSSYPWNEWSNYPTDPNGYAADKNVDVLDEKKGYYLISWLVNGTTIGSVGAYPGSRGELDEDEAKAEYERNVDSYLKIAEDLGTYDIIVYTAYVAQDKQSGILNLTASANPLMPQSTIAQYTLPGSMQEGMMTYTLDLDSLELVDGDTLGNILFDSANSNRQVAIKATLYDENDERKGEQWLLADNTNKSVDLFTVSVAGGWKITLQLYHSSVVTLTKEHEFTLTIGFKSTSVSNGEIDPLENQKVIFSNSRISMQPSVYTVEYTANLPYDAIVDDSMVKNWNGFDHSTGKYSTTMPYGSALLSKVPEIEGYHAGDASWTRGSIALPHGGLLSGDAADSLAKEAVATNREAVIRLTTSWEINTHTLEATRELLERWNIFYGTDRRELSADTPVTINFRTPVSISPKDALEYPEFVQLKLSTGVQVRVDSYSNVGGEYQFVMPDADVNAFFQQMLTLYLEEGSIDIDTLGYKQSGLDVVWRGDYTVLMDIDDNKDNSSTPNCLSFNGDLADRTICLGNLNVTSQDSISLAEDTTVTLTLGVNGAVSVVQGSNISVPAGAILTIIGQLTESADKGSLSLTPVGGAAAIGGNNEANGEITLKGLNIYMHMTPSTASGIGPGNQTVGGQKVTLTDCDVTVKQTASYDVYRGVWIGGVGVERVELTGTTVSRDASGENIRLVRKAIDGDTVILDKCMIGTASVPVTNTIHAKTALTIRDTGIYQSLAEGIALGTDGGITDVYNSKIQSDVENYQSLYSGKLLIRDVNSDVVIADTQILEIAHGDVSISDTQVTQDNATFDHDKSYLIMHEDEIEGGMGKDLAIHSISPAATITLRGVEIGELTVGSDVSVVVEGSVTLQDTIKIADGKTLTTMVKDGDQLIIAKGFDTTTSGHYFHTGGSLVGNADIVVGGDLTFVDTNVSANGHKVGSVGVDGVTTVRVDGSSIEAAVIGALGEYDRTFTFVVEANGATFSGTLVRDCFRLAYDVDASELPQTLRSETKDGLTTYSPGIPANPSSVAGFAFWYIVTDLGEIRALGDTFVETIVSLPGLDATHIAYAETDNGDGTRTLTVHAFMHLVMSGAIKPGKLLNQNEATSDVTSVSIYGLGKWTAMYRVEGVAFADASYVFKLEQPFPKDTQLTLGVMHLNVPTFYYYVCKGDEREIAVSQFTRMGSGEPCLLDVCAGEQEADMLIIVADFSNVQQNESVSNTVTLDVMLESSSLASFELGYSTIEDAAVTVGKDDVMPDLTVDVKFDGDRQLERKYLYLVAIVNGSSDLPYRADLMVGNTAATRIGANTWFLPLGEAVSGVDINESYRFAGLGGGRYTVRWMLTVAEPNTRNVLGHTLTESDTVEFEVETEEPAQLQLDGLLINGASANIHTLSSGKDHTLVLTLTANRDISVALEKQNENGVFVRVDAAEITPTDNGYSVTLPSTLTEGIYRITLSIEENTVRDDVYISFLLMAEK